MQQIKAGDPLAPVIATHVVGVKQIGGIIFRMEYVTRDNQPVNEVEFSANFIMKSGQARALAQNLLDAADGIDQAEASSAAPAALPTAAT